MKPFAANTKVSVEQTRMEIERTVRRYGADAFTSGWDDRNARIQFRCANRVMRFTLELPSKDEKRFTQFRHSTGKMLARTSPTVIDELWEQACRQKWRALALLVKAKLEAVDAGISSIEEEFLGNIVDPQTGKTVYERVREPLALSYDGAAGAQLLLG